MLRFSVEIDASERLLDSIVNCGTEMIRLDLHVHSKYSFDSMMDIKKIMKEARKKRLDGLAITDHNAIVGAEKAVELSKDSLLVVVGSEISTDFGDITGLFLTDNIKTHNVLEVLDEIKAQGGITVLPHPFKRHKLTEDKVLEVLNRIDCVEILNSRSPITAKEYQFLKTLKRGLIAGSDAHFPFEIGLCQTLIDKSSDDLEEVKKRIFSGRTATIGTFGPRCFRLMSQMIEIVKLRYRLLARSDV